MSLPPVLKVGSSGTLTKCCFIFMFRFLGMFVGIKKINSFLNSQNPFETPIKAKAIDPNMATKLISIRLIVLHKSVVQHTPDVEHNK